MSRIASRITSSAPKNYGMYAKAARLANQGDLIHLELGQPAHDTPEHIKAATIAAIRAGHVLGAMMKVTANDVTHVNTCAQYGALEAVTGDPASLRHMVEDERIKRDFLVNALNRMPGVACLLPQGSIYAFADIRRTGLDSQTLADRLLEDARVVVESGAFYGAQGEGRRGRPVLTVK